MRHVLRLALGPALILCAGTALADPPPVPTDANYFPLAKGTKWVYKVGDNEVTVVATGSERVKDEDWYTLESRVGREAKTTEMYAVRDTGVYRMKIQEDPLVPPVKVLPLPVRAGDTWVVNSKIGSQSVKGTLALTSDRARVKVPAGEFDAVLVEGSDLDIPGAKTSVRIWYAHGYGIIKEEFVLQTGDKVVLELVKFEPGEAPPPAVRPEPVPMSPPVLVVSPAWAFPQRCRILPPRCIVLSATTQECCGCYVRPGRCWVRRR
jgi:hypothetical protein